MRKGSVSACGWGHALRAGMRQGEVPHLSCSQQHRFRRGQVRVLQTLDDKRQSNLPYNHLLLHE